MRNPKMMKRVSVKCAAAIMTAVMTISPVAGAVAMPLVAYAADYNTTEDVPVDNENHRNLAVGDNLATNTGIIHENNGTIEVNMPGASVEENNNVVEDNYGDVDNSNTGRVETNHVGGQVHNGNVTDNYGTADSSANVENNYAGATVSGNDNIVTNNWGTVTGVNQVTNNMGTVTGETVNANNYAGGTVNGTPGTGEGPAPAAGKATDPAPNPPAALAPQVAPEPAAPAPEPEPEPAPEPEPEPAPVIEEDTTIPATNIYGNDPIKLQQIVEESLAQDCPEEFTDRAAIEYGKIYKLALSKALNQNKSLEEARRIAREEAYLTGLAYSEAVNYGLTGTVGTKYAEKFISVYKAAIAEGKSADCALCMAVHSSGGLGGYWKAGTYKYSEAQQAYLDTYMTTYENVFNSYDPTADINVLNDRVQSMREEYKNMTEEELIQCAQLSILYEAATDVATKAAKSAARSATNKAQIDAREAKKAKKAAQEAVPIAAN